MQFHFALDTKATPDQVVAAFTDFTDRRLEIWKETLDPAKYEVHEVGDTWAIVREGSARPSVWAVERYDWSQPGIVEWAVQDSNFCAPGSGVELSITPNATGGSRLEGNWHRVGRGLKGRMVVSLARLMLPGSWPKEWRATLDRYADTT